MWRGGSGALVCGLHAIQLERAGAWGWPLAALPVIVGDIELTSAEVRAQLQVASYERRAQPMKVTADQVFEAVSVILRRGVGEVGIPPPEIERTPGLDPGARRVRECPTELPNETSLRDDNDNKSLSPERR
jgi:hypothetical protein